MLPVCPSRCFLEKSHLLVVDRLKSSVYKWNHQLIINTMFLRINTGSQNVILWYSVFSCSHNGNIFRIMSFSGHRGNAIEHLHGSCTSLYGDSIRSKLEVSWSLIFAALPFNFLCVITGSPKGRTQKPIYNCYIFTDKWNHWAAAEFCEHTFELYDYITPIRAAQGHLPKAFLVSTAGTDLVTKSG